MKKIKVTKKTIIRAIFLSIIVLFTLNIVYAADNYQVLEPTVTGGFKESEGLEGYLSGMFNMLIGLTIGLATMMIIFGGVKYMTTEAMTGKGDAKKTIQDAVKGLILALASWLILYTINPDILDFKFSSKLQTEGDKLQLQEQNQQPTDLQQTGGGSAPAAAEEKWNLVEGSHHGGAFISTHKSQAECLNARSKKIQESRIQKVLSCIKMR